MQMYQCDVCQRKIEDNVRKVIMLKGQNDLCKTCAKDIMDYIDLLKVIPSMRERIGNIHKQLFKE